MMRTTTMKYFRSFLTLALCALPLSALAQEEQAQAVQKQYGLAMHGDAKYSQSDDHLDYVNPDAPKGGTIKMAAIGTFDTINPYSIKGKAALGLNLVYDRLMQRVWDEPFTSRDIHCTIKADAPSSLRLHD